MVIAGGVLAFMGLCLCLFEFLDKQKLSLGHVVLFLAGLIFMGFSFALMGSVLWANVCLLGSVAAGFILVETGYI